MLGGDSRPSSQELAVGLDAVPDALGVVEPVDAEQQQLGVAQLGADLLGALLHLGRAGQLVERVGVDRDGERGRAHVPAGSPVPLGLRQRDDLPARGQVGEPTHHADEVGGVAGALEADEVGAEQALDHLLAPRQLREQLERRQRDVVEVADPQVRPQLAQHLGDQLQLVVVHPHGGAAGGLRGGRLGEPPVDPLVGLPPVPVERGRLDDVVVQRPQGVVGEALVELLEVVLGEHARGSARCRRRRTARARGRATRPSPPTRRTCSPSRASGR